MVVSDILRAAVVLLIPVAAVVNIVLVYPLIFLVTSDLGLLPAGPRRDPARGSSHEEDLLTANSALWVGETIADVIGYPLAGLFVAPLGHGRAARVLVRPATYLASAVLLATDRRAAASDRSNDEAAEPPRASSPSSRRLAVPAAARPSLLANTLQARSPSSRVGILIALTAASTPRGLRPGRSATPASTASSRPGSGRQPGRRVPIGLIGVGCAKGRMIIVGYAVSGCSSSCSP